MYSKTRWPEVVHVISVEFILKWNLEFRTICILDGIGRRASFSDFLETKRKNFHFYVYFLLSFLFYWIICIVRQIEGVKSFSQWVTLHKLNDFSETCKNSIKAKTFKSNYWTPFLFENKTILKKLLKNNSSESIYFSFNSIFLSINAIFSQYLAEIVLEKLKIKRTIQIAIEAIERKWYFAQNINKS